MVSVILIEDDVGLRAELKLGLEKAGHTVMDAASGNEGLAIFSEHPVDIVITDVVMEDGEGVETMLRFHELASEIQVIAISGNPSYLKSMEKLGAAFLLLKPFSIKALNEAIGKVL